MTGPRPQALGEIKAYWQKVRDQTGSDDQANKATEQKFGPPPPRAQVADASAVVPATPPAQGSSLPGAGYNAVDAAVNGATLGLAPQLKAGTQAVAPREGLDEVFGSPVAPVIPGAFNQQLAGIHQSQGAFQHNHPVLNTAAELGGAVLGGGGLAKAVNGTATTLVKLTGLAPTWAQRVAPYIVATGAGAVAGGPAGALLGPAMVGGTELAQKAVPFIRYLAGRVGEKSRQSTTNYLILDNLARTNQTVADAMDRAEQILQATGKSPSVAESMGAPAATDLLNKQVSMVSPEAGGKATAGAQAMPQIPVPGAAPAPAAPPPVVTPRGPLPTPQDIAGMMATLGYKPKDIASALKGNPSLRAAIEQSIGVPLEALGGDLETLFPDGRPGRPSVGAKNNFAPPVGTPPDQIQAALEASLAQGKKAFVPGHGTPFTPAETQQATQVALGMGLAPKDAKITAELAEEINAGRTAIAKALGDAAMRNPKDFHDVVDRISGNAIIRMGGMEKLLLLVPGQMTRKTLQAENVLKTLLDTDPVSFYSNLNFFRATDQGQKLVSKVLQASTVGSVAGRLVAPPGTTYQPQ